MTVICPTVIRPEDVAILRAWGVAAPDPRRGLSPFHGSFVDVAAPAGWTVQMDDLMRRVLRDARGFARALYYEKRAFYDREVSFYRAYTAVEVDAIARYDLLPGGWRTDRKDVLWQPLVVLGRRWVLWTGEPQLRGDDLHAASLWAAEHYPNHADPMAYWHAEIPAGAVPFKEPGWPAPHWSWPAPHWGRGEVEP